MKINKMKDDDSMLKRNYLFIVAIIIAIFASYNYLSPLNSNDFDEYDYSLKTFDISKENKLSDFKEHSSGKFFIQPGEKKAASGVFTFYKERKLIWDFSIDKGSKTGDIEFTVKKNGQKIDKSIVTSSQLNQITMKVKRGDRVEVIASKHGNASGDWGNIDITAQDEFLSLKNFLIPFLWSILFIFLFGKKHTYIAINSYLLFVLVIFAEKLNFGTLSFETILAYMLLLFALTFIFTLVYQELTRLKKFKIATIVSFAVTFIIYIIPLFSIIYALNFDTKVTMAILHTVFQSNSSESYEFVCNFISWKYILLFIFITAMVGTLLTDKRKKRHYRLKSH